MKEFMIRILKKGKAIAFLFILLFVLSFFSDFSRAQPSNQFQSCIWVGTIIKPDGEFTSMVQGEDDSSLPGTIKIYTGDTGGMPISDAAVYLDGHYVGVTDQTGWLAISDVSPGDHTIEVVKEEFIDYQEIFEVRSEETLYLELTMEKPTNWSYILALILIVGGGIVLFKYSRKEEKRYNTYSNFLLFLS